MKLIVAGKREEESSTSCLLASIVAVVVILILGVISAPHFLKFIASRDRQSEVKINLAAVFKSQLYYLGDRGNYAGGRDCFAVVGWSPEGDTQYSYYCSGDVIPCSKPGCSDCGGIEAFHLKPVSSFTGFTIYAIGNIDRDSTDCDVWSINDAKEKRNIKNDLDNGWWR